MEELINKYFGKFRLVKYIGRGGFAEVYRAESIDNTKKQAAVKVLHLFLRSDDSERLEFMKEAEKLEKLKHPNIIEIFEYGVKDGYGETREYGLPYIAMSLAREDLEIKYPLGKQVPLETVRDHVRQIASALQYAHNKEVIHKGKIYKGIMHLDLKPNNILVGPKGNLLVCDFGLARFIEKTTHQPTLSIIGTYAYIAPEQIKGQPDKECDQYALGIIIYRWLSGDLPFTGTEAELIHKHLKKTPPSLRKKMPNISKELERVILRSLKKNPTKRFESIDAFASAFERACQSPVAPPQSRWRIALFILIVVMVILGGGGVYIAFQYFHSCATGICVQWYP